MLLVRCACIAVDVSEVGLTAGSKSWDSKPAMRLSLASTSLLSAAVLGAPCTRDGMAPCPAPCCSVTVLNFSPRAGSSSSKARCDLCERHNFVSTCVSQDLEQNCRAQLMTSWGDKPASGRRSTSIRRFLGLVCTVYALREKYCASSEYPKHQNIPRWIFALSMLPHASS